MGGFPRQGADKSDLFSVCTSYPLYLSSVHPIRIVYMYRTVYSFLQNTNADRFRAVCAIIRKNNKTVKIILQRLTKKKKKKRENYPPPPKKKKKKKKKKKS